MYFARRPISGAPASVRRAYRAPPCRHCSSRYTAYSPPRSLYNPAASAKTRSSTPPPFNKSNSSNASSSPSSTTAMTANPKATTLPLPTLPCLSKLLLTSISASKTFCAMWVGVIRFLRACWVTFSSVLDLLVRRRRRRGCSMRRAMVRRMRA
ncbi:hypothetical protein M438DRAFT_198577 [Aureobasidium pullulans EXF-150]|uniref:Uncharacterized protein n=1 Tax=Aureobasidium pullulans EXF-150 TaxID=1043002 RepID=A0A074XJD2_AURPU|nr:uncharacterized protein M438DRAFT_198577 [Aureobasidium pullulans EXF-150]KEQ85610.1 hypothetical protein M438DRAFT_198577 [Aureobasidium pullulans EXF-150]